MESQKNEAEMLANCTKREQEKQDVKDRILIAKNFLVLADIPTMVKAKLTMCLNINDVSIDVIKELVYDLDTKATPQNGHLVITLEMPTKNKIQIISKPITTNF